MPRYRIKSLNFWKFNRYLNDLWCWAASFFSVLLVILPLGKSSEGLNWKKIIFTFAFSNFPQSYCTTHLMITPLPPVSQTVSSVSPVWTPGECTIHYTLELQTKVIWRFLKISQSRRRPLWPSPGWKHLLVLSHLRHY